MGMKNTSQAPDGRSLWCVAAGGREWRKHWELLPPISCHVFLSDPSANGTGEPTVCSRGLRVFSWIGCVVLPGLHCCRAAVSLEWDES